MKVLIDCGRLSRGGGIQVGLAFLANAAKCSAHEWHAALSPAMSAEADLPLLRSTFGSLLHLDQSSRSVAQFTEAFYRLPGYEKQVKPDVVFTVFGPTLWRPRAPHLCGFAVPSLLYPEIASKLRASRKLEFVRRKLTDLWSSIRLRRGRDWLVESDTVKRRLNQFLHVPAERIFVVRNSYSPLFAQDRESSQRHPVDRRVLSKTEGVPSVLVPSAYYLHKNLRLIPRVAKALRTVMPLGAKFVLTLPADQSPWRSIHEEATALGVGDDVVTVGSVRHETIGRLYSHADAVLLPTLLECSTAVYPESFLAGVPLVTSDLDFAHEFCSDAAEYFDPWQPESAAGALHRVLSDPQRRARLIDRGREVLKSNYPSPEEKWNQQLACLQAVAAGRSSEQVELFDQSVASQRAASV
ncbi:N/A [soil metagenome]